MYFIESKMFITSRYVLKAAIHEHVELRNVYTVCCAAMQIRVPTHEDGSCLFWEFATDSYDIGFGVYFEWSLAPGNQVSVQVCESSEEDDDEGVCFNHCESVRR